MTKIGTNTDEVMNLELSDFNNISAQKKLQIEKDLFTLSKFGHQWLSVPEYKKAITKYEEVLKHISELKK